MSLPPFLPNIANMLPYLNLQMFMQQQQQQQQALAAAQLSPNQFCNGTARSVENIDCDEDEDVNMSNDQINRLNDIHSELDISHPESPTSSVPNSNPNSLNNCQMNKTVDVEDDDHQSSENDCHILKPNHNSISVRYSDPGKLTDNGTTASSSSKLKMYDCKFCGISFQDAVLHTIHMGYHGYNDVFTCNMCGEKSADRITFNLHIAKNQHM